MKRVAVFTGVALFILALCGCAGVLVHHLETEPKKPANSPQTPYASPGANPEVEHQPPADGLYFTLPRTRIKVDVTVTKKSREESPFFQQLYQVTPEYIALIKKQADMQVTERELEEKSKRVEAVRQNLLALTCPDGKCSCLDTIDKKREEIEKEQKALGEIQKKMALFGGDTVSIEIKPMTFTAQGCTVAGDTAMNYSASDSVLQSLLQAAQRQEKKILTQLSGLNDSMKCLSLKGIDDEVGRYRKVLAELFEARAGFLADQAKTAGVEDDLSQVKKQIQLWLDSKGKAESPPAAVQGCSTQKINNFFLELQRSDINISGQGMSAFSIDSTSVSALPEPDPKQVFLLELNASPMQERDLILKLADLGYITNSATTVKDLTTDNLIWATGKLIDFLPLIAHTAPAAAILRAEGDNKGEGNTGKPQTPPAFCVISDEPTTSLTGISEVRSRRSKLVSSPNRMSKETLDLMLAELKKEEDRYLAYFSAPVSSQTKTIPALYLPGEWQPDNPEEGIVGVLSQEKGFIPNATAGGTPLKIKLEAGNKSAAVVQQNLKDRPDRNHGLPYRFPTQARITVSFKDQTLQYAWLPIAQWGTVACLPTGAGSILSTYELIYYPETGAVQSVHSIQKGFELQSLDPTVGKYLEYRKTLKEEEAEAADPTTRMKKEKEFLELQRDIEKLKKELNEMNGANP